MIFDKYIHLLKDHHIQDTEYSLLVECHFLSFFSQSLHKPKATTTPISIAIDSFCSF